MLSSQRVIWSKNGVLSDVSLTVNDLFSAALPFLFAGAADYLYLGSDVPFNHRYFKVPAPNITTGTVAVHIWDGNSWIAAVDVIDETEVAGAKLSASGILSWKTDKNKTWGKEYTTEDMAASGLETLKIYNMYWVRIKWSGTLTGSVSYMGHKFSKDADLGGYYPDLNRSNVKAAFATGKVDWNDQHIMAAEDLFREIRSKRALWARDQIFDWQVFTAAAVHKVAEIIYAAMGEEYETRMEKANTNYLAALEGSLGQGIDFDEDGHIEEAEHEGTTVGMFRR